MFSAIKHIPHRYLVKGFGIYSKETAKNMYEILFIKYLLLDPNSSFGIDFF